MGNTSIFFIIIIILIFLSILYIIIRQRYVKINGEYYRVYGKQAKKAAYILDDINNFNIELLRHIRDKYLYNNYTTFIRQYGKLSQHTYNKRCNLISYLLWNYDPNKLQENFPYNTNGYTAYVLGKGEELNLCIRDKSLKSMKFTNRRLLEFVDIHELSHMSVEDYDHDDNFWNAFKFLLYEAQIMQNYIYQVGTNYDNNYCGLEVRYNPLDDNTLKEYFD